MYARCMYIYKLHTYFCTNIHTMYIVKHAPKICFRRMTPSLNKLERKGNTFLNVLLMSGNTSKDNTYLYKDFTVNDYGCKYIFSVIIMGGGLPSCQTDQMITALNRHVANEKIFRFPWECVSSFALPTLWWLCGGQVRTQTTSILVPFGGGSALLPGEMCPLSVWNTWDTGVLPPGNCS